MKIAVIKLGARIILGDKVGSSGASGEARSIINMLVEAGADVHCFTKILPKDESVSGVTLHQIEDEYDTVNDYDQLVVINGTVNFFGGQEDRAQILNYWMINHFNEVPLYIHCDPNLPLKQVWPAIKGKSWSEKWNESDIVISKPIDVISQSTNEERIVKAFSDISIQKLSQFDFQKFPMMFPKPTYGMFGREITSDLSYGGTFRSGRREKKLIEFYFGHPEDLHVEIFGKIKLSDFNEKKIKSLRPPIFTGPVDYDRMLHKMSESKAHIAIGDGQYPEFGMISQRIYESVMAGCITFIDEEFDPTRKVFGSDPNLSKFVYVKNKRQVYDRIKAISDSDINKITALQHNAIGFDREAFCNNFLTMIENGKQEYV